MEFTSLIFPQTKNICRTCLAESDTAMFMNIQDLVENEMNKVKLIDILVFLNCLENNDEENWPHGMCATCVSTALTAYNFKLNCLKVNSTLSQLLSVENSNLQHSDIDSIDINVVYQDHEYELPLFNHSVLYQDHQYDVPIFSRPTTDLKSNNTAENDKKELTPLPPVSEITSAEQPPRQEGDKCYTCIICSKAFTRVHSLRHHLTKHTDERNFLCSKCGKAFHTNNGLRQHLISHKDGAQFKCGFCNKKYKSRQSLKEHFRIAHSSNSKLFICVICGKRFTAKSSLRAHNKIHTGEKQFTCPYCPKIYSRASYLKLHMMVHSGEERPRPYLCNYINCNRSFFTKHSLLIHIAHAHTSERPHKCVVCSKGFATVAGLREHRDSHSAKELACDVCPKKCATKRALQKHVRTHEVTVNDMILENNDITLENNDKILETVVNSVFLDHHYTMDPEQSNSMFLDL